MDRLKPNGVVKELKYRWATANGPGVADTRFASVYTCANSMSDPIDQVDIGP